ncbi:MAG TPA: hypothetical protein VIH71_09550 [Solirubrobacteraceae bacterium]
MALSRTDNTGTVATGNAAGVRWAAFTRGVSAPAIAWAIPLLIAAVYVIVFLIKLSHNLTALGWESDYSSTFLQAETLAKVGSGGETVMASAGQWVPLWFGLLTARLPLHRELWTITPTLLFIASALTVGWSVSKVADRRAAVLAVLIGVIASPLALAFFMAEAHNTVYPCTALLGAYLVWLARGEQRRRLVTVAVPPLLGVVIGTCMASDLLVVATATVPLGVTALLVFIRRDRLDRHAKRVWLSALTTIAVAVPIAKLTTYVMSSLHFLTLPAPIKFASLSELPQRGQLLFKGLKALFNGYLGPERPGTLHTELGIASDVVMSVALIALLGVGAFTTVRFVASGLRKRNGQAATEFARSLHVIYWVVSAVSVCGAYWIAGEGSTTTHESYYGTAIFSVAAVIPLLLATRAAARWLIAGCMSLFFTASLVGLSNNYIGLAAGLEHSSAAITKIAQAFHVKYGYGTWLDASALTWETHERVIVRPVVVCEYGGGVGLCPGFQDLVTSWYIPQQRHTFLLIEDNGVGLGSLPEGLGKPLAAYRVDSMSMYIYPYDIASRLGRPA